MMIKIASLNKTYRSKKRRKSHALKDINLTLPDAGLIFVLGKSGSGKSTLLNLIGGLDSITSGSIEVDGNNLSAFSEGDFCNYRNTHIGFIFQDYHLIDELTVYENIVLSLNLRRVEDLDKVKKALEKVDLAGYGDRYPTELSGGEQQRVAIARAIVKNPRIILADEPTGNLDTNTAKSIVELLKTLSKDCLILIVSHNVNDAYSYADRIIELANGTVISDKTRNPEFSNEVTYKDGALVYPNGAVLSDKDIELINNNFNKNAKIIKRTDKFIKTPEESDEAKTVEIENKSLSFKNELNLSGKFLKNKTLSIALSSFMVAVIMVIMALSQTIIYFDAGEIISNEMVKNEQKTLLLNKVVDEETADRLDRDYRARIDGGDIKALYDAGYKGEIYPVLNSTVPISECRNIIGITSPNFGKSIFLKEALGTMVVDEGFFERKFGEIRYLAKLDEPYPYGLIITDYIADCILASNTNYVRKDYNRILGEYKPSGWSMDSVYVNAIIYTGYREAHSKLIESIGASKNLSFSELYSDREFIAFSNAIYEYLGYSYSLNPNYAENAHLSRCFYSHKKLVINDSIEYLDNFSPYVSILDPKIATHFKGNTATMSYMDYNDIFGTEYDNTNLNTFVPHSIKLSSYDYYDINNESPLFTVEVFIDALHTYNDTLMLSKGAFPELEEIVGKNDSYCYGLYLDGTEGVGAVLDRAKELNLEHQSFSIEGIHTMTKAVDVFVPIFRLIAIFLCVGVVFILMNFSTKMIKDKMHEIGILKALGTKNSSIGIVFGLQVALIAILTCILITAGYFFFIDLANDVLIESLKRLAPNHTVLDLHFLVFKPWIAMENCALIFILAILALVFPLIKIKAIKPVKIIKAKD